MASATVGSAKPHESKQPLSQEELRKMHAYWRAANYLLVGQIYLYANPLLQEPLKLEHIKPRIRCAASGSVPTSIQDFLWRMQ